MGPERIRPMSVMIIVSNERFELETAPQRKAHIGGNHVMGLIRVIIAKIEGKFLSGTLDAVVINPAPR